MFYEVLLTIIVMYFEIQRMGGRANGIKYVLNCTSR